MARYTGSIIITNEKSELIFERLLTMEEIVDVMVKESRRGDAGDEAPPKAEKIEKAAVTVGGFKTGCKKCGKKGHYTKTCPEGKKESIVDNFTPKRDGSGKIRFSLSAYNTVKSMYEKGMTSDAIAREKGFNMAECWCIKQSPSYEEYMK